MFFITYLPLLESQYWKCNHWNDINERRVISCLWFLPEINTTYMTQSAIFEICITALIYKVHNSLNQYKSLKTSATHLLAMLRNVVAFPPPLSWSSPVLVGTSCSTLPRWSVTALCSGTAALQGCGGGGKRDAPGRSSTTFGSGIAQIRGAWFARVFTSKWWVMVIQMMMLDRFVHVAYGFSDSAVKFWFWDGTFQKCKRLGQQSRCDGLHQIF